MRRLRCRNHVIQACRLYVHDHSRHALQIAVVCGRHGDADLARRDAGGLQHGAVISAGDYFFPRLLAAFGAVYPGISFRLTVHNREGLLRQLAENLTDLAVMVRPPRDMDIVALPFAPHPYVIVAAPDHPLARARQIPRTALNREPFVLRFRVPRDPDQTVTFRDAVYGEQSKSTADIEDFALLRSNGLPTYHMASCADDADLRISHIVRGQDHLTNTFKHILIFEALGIDMPQTAHLPLLMAPDGAKLSKRIHGPVVGEMVRWPISCFSTCCRTIPLNWSRRREIWPWPGERWGKRRKCLRACQLSTTNRSRQRCAPRRRNSN